MFHPCFGEDFQLGWTFLRYVESGQPEALTELVDKLNTAELEVEKAHISCVFQKEVARWLKDCATNWAKISGRLCTHRKNMTLLKM